MSAAGTLRPCITPGCPELVETGRCAQHQAARYREQSTTPEAQQPRLYDTHAWKRARAAQLRAHPWCQIQMHCATGSITDRIATEVDHIISVRERPDLRLDYRNLQSACKPCHSAKTLSEMRKLTNG